jgi:serralysin
MNTGLKLKLVGLSSAIALAVPALAVATTAAAHGRVAVGAAAERVEQLDPVLYKAIDGHTETLIPWQGRHVSVLVEPGVPRDRRVMGKLVGALDRAWEYYAETVGRVPAVAHSLNGRDEIAEVASTCGAGCTYLGATGTEMLTPYFESMYQQIAQSNLYDQIPFYELGRSFWFWSPQLQFQSPDQDPIVTGFAVWMRFRSMAAAGVEGAPFNATPFETFASQVEALASQYEANPSLTFAETLAQDHSPGLYGGTDFWASLMTQLAARHGGQTFVARFWHDTGTLPAASSTTGAVTNWVQDASYAACTDLSSVFYARWGFPRPDGTVASRSPAAAVPEPQGRCSQGWRTERP